MPISTPSQITVPFATSGLKNAIPAASNPVTGNAGYDQGFPAITMTPKTAGGIPPFGQDFNGIFFAVTEAIRFIQAGGNYPYSSAFSTAVGGYPLGAIVARADGLGSWRNLVANNTSNPDTGGAGWVPGSAGPTTGSVRNLQANLGVASATNGFTADEVVVATGIGGTKYTLASYSQTINLATVGAGGMDTGSAPVSGSVAVYALYNPITGARSIVATNATSIIPTATYTYANLPAGFTASALISIWRTNASGQFLVGNQIDRRVYTAELAFLNTTANPATPAASTSTAIPYGAKSIGGNLSVQSTAVANLQLTVAGAATNAGKAANTGQVSTANITQQVPFANIPLPTPQTVYYTFAGSAGTGTAVATMTNYEF